MNAQLGTCENRKPLIAESLTGSGSNTPLTGSLDGF